MAVYDIFNYTNNGSSITINGLVAGTSYSGAVNIPTSIDGLPVTILAANAFLGCANITSVTIPNSVSTIGNYCFKNCSVVTSVTNVVNGSTGTSYYVYRYKGLSSVVIPSSVINIGNYSFQNCKNLAYAEFLGNIPTIIGTNIFADCVSQLVIKYHSDITGWTTPTVNLGGSTYNTICIYPLSMNFNLNGVWKSSSDIKCNINGVWKSVTDIWTNIEGVWKKNS